MRKGYVEKKLLCTMIEGHGLVAITWTYTNIEDRLLIGDNKEAIPKTRDNKVGKYHNYGDGNVEEDRRSEFIRALRRGNIKAIKDDARN